VLTGPELSPSQVLGSTLLLPPKDLDVGSSKPGDEAHELHLFVLSNMKRLLSINIGSTGGAVPEPAPADEVAEIPQSPASPAASSSSSSSSSRTAPYAPVYALTPPSPDTDLPFSNAYLALTPGTGKGLVTLYSLPAGPPTIEATRALHSSPIACLALTSPLAPRQLLASCSTAGTAVALSTVPDLAPCVCRQVPACVEFRRFC
jgi:hypothetical protein